MKGNLEFFCEFFALATFGVKGLSVLRSLAVYTITHPGRGIFVQFQTPGGLQVY